MEFKLGLILFLTIAVLLILIVPLLLLFRKDLRLKGRKTKHENSTEFELNVDFDKN